MEAEFKNKIRTFEAVFDRKIRTSRLDFRKCSYKINGVYVKPDSVNILKTGTFHPIHMEHKIQ